MDTVFPVFKALRWTCSWEIWYNAIPDTFLE